MRTLLLVAVGVGVVFALRAGLFYQTGAQWFEACWHQSAEATDFEKPKPATPEQAIAWATCEPKAGRALYRSGLILTWFPDGTDDTDSTTLERQCPSGYRNIYLAGSYILVVKLVEANGGPQLLDQFLPAERMLERTWQTAWPNCAATRQQQGYPRVVMKGDMWDWAEPCIPCSTHKKILKNGQLMNASQ